MLNADVIQQWPKAFGLLHDLGVKPAKAKRDSGFECSGDVLGPVRLAAQQPMEPTSSLGGTLCYLDQTHCWTHTVKYQGVAGISPQLDVLFEFPSWAVAVEIWQGPGASSSQITGIELYSSSMSYRVDFDYGTLLMDHSNECEPYTLVLPGPSPFPVVGIRVSTSSTGFERIMGVRLTGVNAKHAENSTIHALVSSSVDQSLLITHSPHGESDAPKPLSSNHPTLESECHWHNMIAYMVQCARGFDSHGPLFTFAMLCA